MASAAIPLAAILSRMLTNRVSASLHPSLQNKNVFFSIGLATKL
jgi:hypothetical protein